MPSLACLILLSQPLIGNEPKRLTSDGRIKFSPSFLSDNEIAYVDFEKPTLTVIKRLKLDDLSVEPLHTGVDKQELEPAFMSGGRYCVFIRASGTLQTEIVVRDEKENVNILQIPAQSGFSGYRCPTFSADGKRVVYSFATGGEQNLFSVNRDDGKDQKQLTSQSHVNNWPDFSPDGNRIAFGSTRDGNFELYSMNADGTGVIRLTDNRFQDVRPKHSPDGTQIAFVSTRSGNHEIYVMNADGTDIRQITHHEERDDYPAWHPDGRHLVIVSERNGSHDLYLIDLTPELR